MLSSLSLKMSTPSVNNEAMDIAGIVLAQREKVREKLKAAARRGAMKTMEGLKYVDRGDYYEIVVKELVITKYGRFGAVFKESQLKGVKVLSGVPPITVTYPKKMFYNVTFQGLKDRNAHFMKQIVQTIKESPKEIHASYRQAYSKAKEEYERDVRQALVLISFWEYSALDELEEFLNKPADEVDPCEMDDATENPEQIILDEQLRLAQIDAEKLMKAVENWAERLRDFYRGACEKGVRNQTDQADARDVDPASVFSVKGTFEETSEQIRDSDIEKQIRKKQVLAKLRAKQIISAAHVKADRLIMVDKIFRASKREKYERNVRNPGAYVVDIEAMLGFKDNPSP
ncbi:hypothetical protein C2S52_001529 [Perilla frutescens var. hirtella]|nr:hypothetical protein C2S52_001529 [Perilla frutescens var. hirtella]